MGPQEHLPAHVERVLHVARRVILRDVERLEVVEVELHLGALGDREAHAREHVDDLVVHLGEGMKSARDDPPAGKRQVGPVGRQTGPPLDAFQDGLPRLEHRLEPRLRLVGLAPHNGPVGRRQARERPQKLRESTPLAEVFDADFVEVSAGGGPLDLPAGAFHDRLDTLVGHAGARRAILPDRGTEVAARRSASKASTNERAP